MVEHHTFIIIGAGLSGLYAAWQLQQQQRDVIVLEARDCLGGRIVSPCIGQQSQSCIDLGPAWVWPQLQPRLNKLLNKLDVGLFKQYTQGSILYEIDTQTIQRYEGASAHVQSHRIVGGSYRLIQALHASLSKAAIHTNKQVVAIEQVSSQVNVKCHGDEKTYSADQVILALPPRLIHQAIGFTPSLSDQVYQQWQNIPTWMAAQSKVLFIYERAFWRQQDLSGEVFSQQGPLTEIYDGSPDNEEYYALTAFVGLTAQQRRQMTTEELTNACMVQLNRLFGEPSQTIKDIYVKDWSQEPYTTIQQDLQGMPQHPQYPKTLPLTFWDNRLLLAGTESAREHGGYLEGALESVDAMFGLLE